MDDGLLTLLHVRFHTTRKTFLRPNWPAWQRLALHSAFIVDDWEIARARIFHQAHCVDQLLSQCQSCSASLSHSHYLNKCTPHSRSTKCTIVSTEHWNKQKEQSYLSHLVFPRQGENAKLQLLGNYWRWNTYTYWRYIVRYLFCVNQISMHQFRENNEINSTNWLTPCMSSNGSTSH